MLGFTDANPVHLISQNYYDFAFLVGMAINLLVHVYFLLTSSALEIKNKVKEKCFKHQIIALAVQSNR